MQNNNRTLHYASAAIAFLVSLVTYMLTIQPSVPLWDCGEFTAAAVQQQVPHPPGAPLFLMLGKLFHLLPFGDPGWRVNLLSVFASAVTILLLYLITVHVIRTFWKEDLSKTGNALTLYGGGLVAALTYTFSDTFWFNAVESEVYAASSLFVAIIVWLMMVWHEKADSPGHERYILLIAYLIGLSTGVHLLSILTIFSIVLLVYLRKYPVKLPTLAITLGIGLVVFYVIYYLIILKMPAFLAGTFPFFRSDAREYPIVNSGFVEYVLGYGTILALVGLSIWSTVKKKEMLALTTTSLVLVIIGYTTYGHILIRANSNPPMNENAPTSLEKLLSYLGREQYGEAPNWPRRYSMEGRYTQYYELFGPWEAPPYKEALKKDGSGIRVPDYSNMKKNMGGELAYMFDYQFKHMYLRYFCWNFVGRMSDVQEAGSPFLNGREIAIGRVNDQIQERYTFNEGMSQHFPINYFMIPLLMGIIGLVYHFKRDPKRATVFLVLFLMTGALAALQQNQQFTQPRERDYFYVGSFMVWAMWVGVGAFTVADILRKRSEMLGPVAILGAVAIVPLNMAVQNWKTHSRQGNYFAFDYAYNILQSCEPNAIVFTNGDNDTFPVWYLQDVAGIRRDVRIVNLSLGNTQWYVRQLKNQAPWGAPKIPLSFSDHSLEVPEEDKDALTYYAGKPQMVSVPVDRKILAQYTNDSATIASGKMSWRFTGEKSGEQYYFTVAHQLIADIIKQTKFTRPIYFSSSIGVPEYTSEFVGLGDFVRAEGMCYRLCPVRQGRNGNVVNIDFMKKSMLGATTDDNVDTSFSPRLKFRNLNTNEVYYDDVTRSYVMNYRQVWLRQAAALVSQGEKKYGREMLNKVNELISLDVFPVTPHLEMQMAELYSQADDKASAAKIARRAMVSIDKMIANPKLRKADRYISDRDRLWQMGAQSAEMAGDFDKAKNYYASATDVSKSEIQLMIELSSLRKYEYNKQYEQGLAEATKLRDKYRSMTGREAQFVQPVQDQLDELLKKLGRAPEATTTVQMPTGNN